MPSAPLLCGYASRRDSGGLPVSSTLSSVCDALDSPQRPGNCLVLAPSLDDPDAQDALCACLLAGDSLAATHLRCVTFDDRARDRFEEWERRRSDWPPRSAHAIEVGTPDARTTDPDTPGVHVSGVAHPDDLTGVGVRLSESLADVDEGESVAVCLHGLSVVLQFVGFDRFYRFCSLLTRRLAAADAAAHYHLDPAGVTDIQRDRLAACFGTVLERADGEWQVHR